MAPDCSTELPQLPPWLEQLIRAEKEDQKEARDPDAFKGIMTRMNADGWRALRILAAEQDTTLNALAIEAFNDLLKKHGKKPSVQNPLVG